MDTELVSSALVDIADRMPSARDLFAAAALAGGLEQGVENDMHCGWWHSPDKIAERAFAIADAMLMESVG